MVRLARDPALRWCRALAVAYGLLVVAFTVTGGKPYYLDGFLPVLIAAGAGPVLAWLQRVPWRRALVPAALVLTAIGLPIVLPILPLAQLHASPVVALNYDAGETVAWPAFVSQIAGVYAGIPQSQRRTTIVLGSNYGEGGAIDRYGPADGLPAAYAVHNAFWLWGPPPSATTQVVAVGFDRGQLAPAFGTIRLVRRLDNHLDVDDDEQGAPVWVCSRPRDSWPALWPRFRSLG